MSRTQKNKVTAFPHTHWVTADTAARHSRGAVPLELSPAPPSLGWPACGRP